MSNSANNNSGNSIFSYITPWIGRILGIVILIVIIIAIAKLLGGNIFGALQGIIGTANAASHALTYQITSCGFAAPPNTSCDESSKTTGCLVSEKCVNGQCTECTEDSQCSPGTCASTKICQKPGGFGGLFNSGCMIGTLFVGYLALQFLAFAATLTVGWAKSKFANKIEAITGKPVTDGVDVIGILESVKEEVDKKIEELQKDKKLPYKDEDENWRKPNPDGDDPEITESDAKDILNNYRKKMVKDANLQALQKKMARNAKAREAQSVESQNKIEETLKQKLAQDREEAQDAREAAEKNGEEYPGDDEINDVVDNVIGE
jgi:hypothetical protein